MSTTPIPSSQTAAFLARAIAFSGKTQRELAAEAGFPSPNFITALKKGTMKVPLERVPALARACHIDPVHFLRIALDEYHPGVWRALGDTIGEPLTANEWALVECYRMAAPDDDIAMLPPVCTQVMDLLLDFKEEEL